MSRSSSSYSVAPSFTSELTESMLPDLSDTAELDKLNSSENIGSPDKDTRIANLLSDARARAYSGDIGGRTRPRTLGLLKRNSDLPGRVQRADDFNTGYFPIGMKTSNSDLNLNKDPYAIEEEVSFAGISAAMNSMTNAVKSSLDDEVGSVEEDSVVGGRSQTSNLSEPGNVIYVNSDAVLSPAEGRVSQEVVPSEIIISPVQSPTKDRSKHDLPSPNKMEPPAVAKKPARSPSLEKKDFTPSEKPWEERDQSVPGVPVEGASRELIVPVMTALQERRPSTPDCSTAEASTDTKVPDRVQSPGEAPSVLRKVSGGDDKKPDIKAPTRSAYTTRVSVKDRMQQYERNRVESGERGRKQSSELFNPNTVASRKQMFEKKDRGLYKRVSDVNTRKPRSDSGSGSSSASGSPKLSGKRLNDIEDDSSVVGATNPASGSPKLPRKRLDDSGDGRSAIAVRNPVQSSPEKPKPVEQEKQEEHRRRHRKDRSEKSDRPQNLVLDNLDKVDSGKSSRPRSGDFESLKLDLHDGEKETFLPRGINIPLDDDFNDKHRPERPRRSPNTSPRNSRTNVRSPFPDNSREEDREPQFV